jgi:hypothetical protein
MRVALLLSCVFVIAVLVTRATPAHADNVTDLIAQASDDSDKVRLSAVLALTRLENHDTKVLFVMIKHVSSNNESSSGVRKAAAFGLGKLIDASANPSVKKLAIASLQKAQSDDDDDGVRTQAGKALAALGAGGGASTSSGSSGKNGNSGTSAATVSGGAGGVYVNIGPMSSKTNSPDDKKLQGQMVTVATQTMSSAAPSYKTDWPGGPPSKAALAQKQVAGFYVDGTLNELKVKEAGSTATISCKVSMLLASYPDKSVFGFLNGGASVQGSTAPRDEAMARGDCVQAVVEDLIRKKIVPTIKSKIP